MPGRPIKEDGFQYAACSHSVAGVELGDPRLVTVIGRQELSDRGIASCRFGRVQFVVQDRRKTGQTERGGNNSVA